MASAAVERYLLEFNDALVAGAERRERILAEVEDHLRDTAQSLVASGSTAAEAEREAVRRFGDPAAAAERFGPDPLGRAQQVARWYDERRTAHPILMAIVVLSPWIGLTVWLAALSPTLIIWALVLWTQLATNLRMHRAAAPVSGGRTRRSRPDLRPVKSAVEWAIAGGYIIWMLSTFTPWSLLIDGYYALCGAAIFSSRLPRCVDPACPHCSHRWAARHPPAAAAARYGAWALALAGPALAQTVPVTAGRTGWVLGFVMLFVALAPLPTHRSQQWLHRRRPLSQVTLRLTPLLALLVIVAGREPAFWILPTLVVAAMAFVGATLEIRRSRWRSAATRRRLLERVRGVAGDGAAG